jgi:CheY-like chemotaxis protein
MRIVGISCNGDAHQICVAAGMDEFLVKPVRLADLVHVLSRLPAS